MLEEKDMNNENVINEACSKVRELIALLEKYTYIQTVVIPDLKSSVMKARLNAFSVGNQSAKEEEELIREQIRAKEEELKQIGNEMKFINPLVWLLYKRRAYTEKDELGNLKFKKINKPIISFGDLIEHCKVDGICSKRFKFINKYWVNKFGFELVNDERYSFDMDLEELAKDAKFLEMLLEVEGEWIKNEYDGNGKWAKY